MRLFDSFERKVVFPAMRVIALISIIALVFAVIVGLVSYLVDAAGAAEQVVTERVVEKGDEESPQRYRLGERKTQILQKYFGNDEYSTMLSTWLGSVDTERTQEFMDGISAIMIEVEEMTGDPGKVMAAAREYAAGFVGQLKDGIVSGTLARLDWIIDVFSLAVAMALIGFFCLVLAVLAIERNTRRGHG